MKKLFDLSPWNAWRDDDVYCNKYQSLKVITRSHSRFEHISGSIPQSSSNIPQTHHKSHNQKQLLKTHRPKQLSAISITARQQYPLLTNNIISQYNSEQYPRQVQVGRSYQNNQNQYKLNKRSKSQDIILKNISKQKQTLPMKIQPLSQCNVPNKGIFRSKSLNVVHNHIKYYKEKIKQKQNQQFLVIKQDKIQELLDGLNKMSHKKKQLKKKLNNYQGICQVNKSILEEVNISALKDHTKRHRRRQSRHLLDALLKKLQ